MFESVKGVRGSGPPAFLTKTLSIVNDPNTNSVISWNLLGNSFIIWDHLQFSAEILPKYFRHSNFSSFIYQLNNYGFRKIGVDHQWEYENPNFQSGKEYLLTNIKRRNQNPQKNLRNENNELKLEIQKLKKQQEEMEFHIVKFEEEVKNIENKSQKLIIFCAKLCEEVFFKENIKETLREDQEKTENNQEELAKEEVRSSENRPVLSSTDDSHDPGKNSGDFMFWKKILLEDDEVDACGNEEGSEMRKEQAKIALDLEGLISKMDDKDNE
ncbi:Heat shock transcription factor [Handroanthus impetiginosus]|uniref:Heat shock transcription factor n=1 Tax=Handroanthus impetiginosus TaxID=429701 RepID=A0A2G9GIS2_9LAMI|nr:Heat shock transcription factor [Handroanthus impetiginosus]